MGAGGVVEEASVTANSTRKPQAGGPITRKPEVKGQGKGAGTYTHMCSVGIRVHHIYVLPR